MEGAGAPPSGPLCCGPHPALSQHLECSLDTLHLSSFGLMDTTLEEVFLKVSEEEQSLENSEAGEALSHSLISPPCPPCQALTWAWGCSLFLSPVAKSPEWEQGPSTPQGLAGVRVLGEWVSVGAGIPGSPSPLPSAAFLRQM